MQKETTVWFDKTGIRWLIGFTLVATAALVLPRSKTGGPLPNPKWNPRLQQVSRGLIFREDFQSFSGWENGGNWKLDPLPVLLVFDPLPVPLISASGQGPGSEADGVREGQLYVEGKEWFLLYDSGDHVSGWLQSLARSRDQGLTWERLGPVNGRRKIGGGEWAATATGWLEKRGGTYYLHRVLADKHYPPPNIGLPAPPYFWDIWKSQDILGPWQGIRQQSLEEGTWASREKNPGSTVFDGSTYHHFAQGSDGFYGVGRTVSATVDGDFTTQGSPIADHSTPAFDGRSPENPKVFFHTGIHKWVMAVNLIATAGSRTDANSLIFSDSLVDWNNCKIVLTQAAGPLDSNHAIGLACHVTGQEGVLISDSVSGMTPFVYDAEPHRYSPGWHLGREIRGAVWEPSKGAAVFSDPDATLNKNLSKPCEHTDFIAEFQLGYHSGDGTNIGFWFRQDGRGDGYRLVVRSCDTLLLQKCIDGVLSPLAVGTGTVLATQGPMNRIRLEVSGNSIVAIINGETQIQSTDNSFTRGSVIAFSGFGAVAEVRAFHMRSSNSIILSALSPGSRVTLRAAGGLPHTSLITPDSGSVTIHSNHWPLTSLQIGDADYTVTDGMIWGGDSFRLLIGQ